MVVDPAYIARFAGFGPKAAVELRAGKILVPSANQVKDGTTAVAEDSDPEGRKTFRHPAVFVGTPPDVGRLWMSALISKAAAEKLRAELLHTVAVHHDSRAARIAEAAVLYHANQLDAVAATRPVD
mgnify:CR=1 FL=1